MFVEEEKLRQQNPGKHVTVTLPLTSGPCRLQKGQVAREKGALVAPLLQFRRSLGILPEGTGEAVNPWAQ